MRSQRTVIIGGGVAAHRCATVLAASGRAGEVTMISDERTAPYDRTLLSKEFLSGLVEADDTLLQPGGYEDAGVEMVLGRRAVALDPQAHRVELSDRSAIGYDSLVIATGAHARRTVPGLLTDPRIHVLRDLPDARALRSQLPGLRRLVVIGAGFVGCEVASTAASLGCEVVIVDRSARPLAAAVGHAAAERMAERHHAKGVRFLGGRAVALCSTDSGVDVMLGDGTHLSGDAVLVGTGIVPNDRWCPTVTDLVDETSRLGGISVDAYGRTGVPDVYAAGDCTRRWSPRTRSWLPGGHRHTAAEHGAAAARTVLAEGEVADLEPFDPVPYFWSHQHGLLVQWLGQVPPGTDIDSLDVEFDDGEAADTFIAHYRHRGRPVAALVVGRPREFAALRREFTVRHTESAA